MGKLTRKMSWQGGLTFEGTGAFGLKLVADTRKEVGGNESGFTPAELLLFGVIGCTGMDTVSILKKMRQDLTALEIEAEGTQPDDYPKPFESIKIRYKFTGNNLDPKMVERAVELSQTKYCMVSLTVAGKTDVSYEINIEE